jgi:AcrR family transcriptional regulator
MGVTVEPGLRERKKQATRASLSHTAWALLLEKGLDAVTPEAVAEAAGVSPRTFRNYFASREEAIVEGVVHRAVSLTDVLRERPAGEPVWDTLIEVLPDLLPVIVGDRDNVRLLQRVARESPAVMAQHHVAFDGIQRQLAEVIAERTGTDIERDLAPRLLTAAAVAAVRTAVEVWAARDDDTTLPDLTRESLAQVRAGIPLG